MAEKIICIYLFIGVIFGVGAAWATIKRYDSFPLGAIGLVVILWPIGLFFAILERRNKW